MSNIKLTSNLNKQVLVKIIQAFDSDDFPRSTYQIPFKMRPKHSDPLYRCCIHKERAAIRERVIAGLGFSVAEDDHEKLLSQYAVDALERNELAGEVLTAIDTACKGCVPVRIHVTDMCQGCVAQSCVASCKFKAIKIENSKAVIDTDLCKNCGKCISACSYSAIARLRVPCEEVCPVKAISKNDLGVVEIDFERCISCGSCVSGCPFGAIHERSQLIDILQAIKSDTPVVAMIAPALGGQFPEPVGKLATALTRAGFTHVVEAAEGADLTILHEAEEFIERSKEGEPFMTTSCCAAYRELITKLVPELEKYVSDTPTPMHYTARIAKDRFPDCITVFVGPCVAKRKEGLQDPYVDYVMSIEEMGALFVAKHIELSECEDYEFSVPSSTEAREFAITGGVSHAVGTAAPENANITPFCIDGLDKKAIALLKSFAGKGVCNQGNLIEVMACQGGCVGGSSILNTPKSAEVKIKAYGAKGQSIRRILETV
ncbi:MULTISPECIES: monomeric [FeFe] hydrogenase [unclassified Oceanispirochaeta]|uniref:monomeric [FeFe] hydrogenase n=1 Tax=unclassified Oceanispirochaeta TaxID=2635722 RepID=UPI000E098491|nr:MULTISPECIES: monomeric [FeFe] hydrogenase [unclassified Oceanispirochaeta]MBF9016577.1 4Fe-4S binding protein [Oceanispirochaeta sp. M2]NPD73040.1 4Fe-4S binding protein [Oceanispirochaeta sp. M1]RDG31386.1 4Fe-4S dicluster domain-containing protein [Oceanispirochaeta sp. M1]